MPDSVVLDSKWENYATHINLFHGSPKKKTLLMTVGWNALNVKNILNIKFIGISNMNGEFMWHVDLTHSVHNDISWCHYGHFVIDWRVM